MQTFFEYIKAEEQQLEEALAKGEVWGILDGKYVPCDAASMVVLRGPMKGKVAKPTASTKKFLAKATPDQLKREVKPEKPKRESGWGKPNAKGERWVDVKDDHGRPAKVQIDKNGVVINGWYGHRGKRVSGNLMYGRGWFDTRPVGRRSWKDAVEHGNSWYYNEDGDVIYTHSRDGTPGAWVYDSRGREREWDESVEDPSKE